MRVLIIPFITLFLSLKFVNGQLLAKGHANECKANLTEQEYESLFPGHFDKYIFASWDGMCDGLGNQMFRFASLYSIGRQYGRKAISKMGQECKAEKSEHDSEGEHEIEELFPVYASQMQFINATEKANDTFYQKGFAPFCCSYTDPEKYSLSRITAKYLEIEGRYFQSHKYLAGRRTEMRQIFQLGQKLCQKMHRYKMALFSNDKSHKLCVHIRIGDFRFYAGVASEKHFTEQGIEFGFSYLKEKISNNFSVSLILMGKEKEFLKNLTFNRQLFAKVYVPQQMPRSNDFAFAILACDSLLITAQASTFAWWIAYLMPDDATIFYNSKFGPAFSHTRENLLPQWIPIRLINGTMALD
ncbi:hypothetical protein niasHS_001131 [Heterodera schachtii]|uniref:L-Fucosyltransferase n=2 Tax=Heterodera TaxID=34509 RepID=A0ABD2KCA7_HETSC